MSVHISEVDFLNRLKAELDQAARQAEQQFGGHVARQYRVAYGEPAKRPLIGVETAAERLYSRAPLFPRIIDVAVIGLEDDATLMFVRPSDHQPSAWDETWNVPHGRGPFKILVNQTIDDRRSKRAKT